MDPEDILSSSLQSLYDLIPVAHSSPGSLFTYTTASKQPITVRTPETYNANWSLHACSIWVSAIYLADHLDRLGLDTLITSSQPLRILELGAGAGLPSILIAKSYENVQVTASDYPDDRLIQTLSDNITHNDAPRCRAIAHAWGSDLVSPLLSASVGSGSGIGIDIRIIGEDKPKHGFDVVFAADTLWNSELHPAFLKTLQQTLKRTTAARIHLVAGLHTGRYTLQAFLDAVEPAGFEVVELTEREITSDAERPWDISAAESDDEQERRRWILWIVLKWNSSMLDGCRDNE